MSNNEETSPADSNTQWKKIVSDFLILIAITATFGTICKLIMDRLQPEDLFGNIVSIVKKDDIDKQGQNSYFVSALQKKYNEDSDFANKQDNHGITLLMRLSYSNNNETMNNKLADITRVYYVQKLMARPGIDPTIFDKDGFNALHWATWSGLPRISTMLLNAGVDINLQENNGYSPLMLAAMRGNKEVVELLLGLGADSSLKNKKGQTAADLAKTFAAAYNQRDYLAFSLIYNSERHAESFATCSILQANNSPKLELSTLMEKIKKDDQAETRKEAKKIASDDKESKEEENRIQKIINEGKDKLKAEKGKSQKA